jgi:hypothetical protein
LRGAEDLTADGLWRRCEDKRSVAEAMVGSRRSCREAWVAAGFGVEFALKAVICSREGFNEWPSKESRPELYTHDIKDLFRAAGIDLKAAPKEVQPAIRQVLDWTRNHDYSATPMPRKMAKGMVEAAFGPNGVVGWLKRL